jgi:hypothetical protein
MYMQWIKKRHRPLRWGIYISMLWLFFGIIGNFLAGYCIAHSTTEQVVCGAFWAPLFSALPIFYWIQSLGHMAMGFDISDDSVIYVILLAGSVAEAFFAGIVIGWIYGYMKKQPQTEPPEIDNTPPFEHNAHKQEPSPLAPTRRITMR